MNFLFILFTMLSLLPATVPLSSNDLNIFTYEKNINSENIMVVHAIADSDCVPVVDPVNKTPIIDFYWLMNRSAYKPVHPLIKKNIRERLTAMAAKTKNVFYINLEDLSEVKIDLPSSRVKVETFRNSNGQCQAVGKITLGGSDGNMTMILKKIFVEAKKTGNPFRPKVVSITLSGLDATSSVPVTRIYEAK
jgi:hypothetical protein